MKNLYLTFFLMFLLSCDQNKETPSLPSQSEIDSTAMERPLEVTRTEVMLVPEAKEITDDWLAYITAQNEIDNFSSYTVGDIIANATPVAEIMQSLRQTLPQNFKTKAVETRLSVLYTKAKVLEHISKRRDLNPAAIAETAEEIPEEFNNFKIQLNELFLKTLEDFEKELDAFEIEDTVKTKNLPARPRIENNN